MMKSENAVKVKVYAVIVPGGRQRGGRALRLPVRVAPAKK